MEKKIKGIKDYIAKTKIRDEVKHRYQLSMGEACSLRVFYDQNSYQALVLTYELGQARGYRAARAEARR